MLRERDLIPGRGFGICLSSLWSEQVLSLPILNHFVRKAILPRCKIDHLVFPRVFTFTLFARNHGAVRKHRGNCSLFSYFARSSVDCVSMMWIYGAGMGNKMFWLTTWWIKTSLKCSGRECILLKSLIFSHLVVRIWTGLNGPENMVLGWCLFFFHNEQANKQLAFNCYQ